MLTQIEKLNRPYRPQAQELSTSSVADRQGDGLTPHQGLVDGGLRTLCEIARLGCRECEAPDMSPIGAIFMGPIDAAPGRALMR